jgi:hypothetical protein
LKPKKRQTANNRLRSCVSARKASIAPVPKNRPTSWQPLAQRLAA